MEDHRVVITGIGVSAPGAIDKDAFLHMISKGLSGIEYSSELEENNLRCHLTGKAKINEDKYKDVFEYFDINDTDDFIELGCYAGLEAWQDAGLKIPDFESTQTDWDTGMILGSGFAGIDYVVNTISSTIQNKEIKKLNSQSVPCSMGSSLVAYLSNILGISNQITANSSACCSGTEAITEAFYKIKFGFAQRMIAGAVEGSSLTLNAMFDAARVTNGKYNDTPKIASRPMSESARGFVPSSGAGIFILESLESAKKRGARIYVEILSGAVNSGGQRNGGSMTFPNNEGVIRCINTSIERAGIKLEDIDLINGHLVATKTDIIEILNWSIIFKGSKKSFPYINATKSMIGHLLGASGAVESIACVLQLYHSFIHPSINCEDIHPKILALIPAESIPQKKIDKKDLNIIIKSSFGFGDVNAIVIFKKWNN